MRANRTSWAGTCLFLHYGIDPPDLPSHCNVYKANFYICHYLDCKNGGLSTTCHNDICDGVDDLTGKYFTPLHVLGDPLIHQGHDVREEMAQDVVPPSKKTPSTTDNLDLKGELLIHDLWKRGADSIHDIRVVNTDALSYQNKSP